MPLKAAFPRLPGPLSHSQGSSQEFAALPWEIPLYLVLAPSQVCLFSIGGSGDSGHRAMPVGEETGLREPPPLSLFDHACKEVSGQRGPLLPTLRPTRRLSCLPAGPHILPSHNACNNSKGLELHKVELVLRAMAGESLAHAPNGCAINRAYQRSMCVSV